MVYIVKGIENEKAVGQLAVEDDGRIHLRFQREITMETLHNMFPTAGIVLPPDGWSIKRGTRVVHHAILAVISLHALGTAHH